MREKLRENISRVRARIVDAAKRVNRNPDDITLIVVTKSVSTEVLKELISLGENNFGENRIQVALPKIEEIGPGPNWHWIGNLQRNKARKALDMFSLMHAVDSVKLVNALDRIAGENGIKIPVFLEVNVSGEENKHGFSPSELMTALEDMRELKSVDVRGLMTMAPYSNDPEDSRKYFRKLRELRDKATSETGLALPDLSMGMTGDFEVAVEEGATYLRVGTAFFEGIN